MKNKTPLTFYFKCYLEYQVLEFLLTSHLTKTFILNYFENLAI